MESSSSSSDDYDLSHTQPPPSGVSPRLSRHDMIKQKIDFLQDDPSTMTYARRAALHLMSRYSWYNPQLREQQYHLDNSGIEVLSDFCTDDDDDRASSSSHYIEMDEIRNCSSFNKSMRRSPVKPEHPSLEKAWAYFEHVTLPRYLDHSSSILSQNSASNFLLRKESSFSKKLSNILREGTRIKTVARVEKRNHLLSNWAVEQKQQQKQQELQQQQQQQQKCAYDENDTSDTVDDIIYNPLSEFCYLSHCTELDNDEDAVMDLAEPGEDRYPTKLYSPLRTPMNQMGDFGLGTQRFI